MSHRILSFPPPGRLMNMNHRTHWGPKAIETKAWRSAAYYAAVNAINAQVLSRRLPKSVVALSLPVASLKVRHDPSNYYPTVKAVVDGLVDAKVFPDDSSKDVATVEPTLHLYKDNPNVVVIITSIGTP